MRVMLPALFASALLATAPAFAAPCASVTALKLPATTITAAEIVAAGAFRPPASQPAALPANELKAFERLPAFCRVQGVIAPSSDSHIEFEVWMPLSGWNGKYLGVGNGGYAGSIMYWATSYRLPIGSRAGGFSEAPQLPAWGRLLAKISVFDLY